MGRLARLRADRAGPRRAPPPLELRRSRRPRRVGVDLPRPLRRLSRRGGRRSPRSSAAPAATTAARTSRSRRSRRWSASLADLLAAEGVEAGSVVPSGNRSEQGAPWGLYPCAGEEQWVAITCRDDADWQGLVAAMGEPAWAADPRSPGSRPAVRAPTSSTTSVGEWTAPRTKDAIAAACQAHGVPAAPMLTGTEQTTDAHYVARAFAIEIDQPGVGPMVLDGAAFHGALMVGPDVRPAPDR